MSYAEIVARWGTYAPVLQQNTGAVWNGGITINVTNLDAVFSTTGFGGAAIRPDCGSVIQNH